MGPILSAFGEIVQNRGIFKKQGTPLVKIELKEIRRVLEFLSAGYKIRKIFAFPKEIIEF
jgi:hypothetical protein